MKQTMATKKNIEQRVEEALNSLDGIRQATPAPFLYTRLKLRLEQPGKTVWENISLFISRPAMAFATICIVLLLNMTVFFMKDSSETVSSPAPDQVEQTFNDAYDVASNTNATILNIWNQNNEQHPEK